jgi:antitoxin (DNA-binding transcriptional repressor) of toxin-antitoxin stability system
LDQPVVIEVGAGVFKDTCLQLLDEVSDGTTEIVVTKRGAAVARVVAVREGAPSAYGFLRGTVRSQGDIVSPDHEAWGDA